MLTRVLSWGLQISGDWWSNLKCGKNIQLILTVVRERFTNELLVYVAEFISMTGGYRLKAQTNTHLRGALRSLMQVGDEVGHLCLSL